MGYRHRQTPQHSRGHHSYPTGLSANQTYDHGGRQLRHRHIPSKHQIVTWLLEHVADINTKYLRGSDGRTAYERLFGKPIHEEGLEFGECVLWKTRQSQDMNVPMEVG